jgi:hypothetical protein
MTVQDITTLLWVYLIAAAAISAVAAFRLDLRLKERLPATRPYMWGFYNGCMGVACGPLTVVAALGRAVAGINGRWKALGFCFGFTVWLAVHTVCRWFIIQRKRWAWVVGTVLSFNIVVCIVNYIYGRNRWGEFVGGAYTPPDDENHKLSNAAIQKRINNAT